MSTDVERLNEANACHDDDPPRGAELLRGIDPTAVPAAQWPTLAFLINHVLGEKLGAWPEALQCQERLLALPSPPAVLWRQAGAAAVVAGDNAAVARATHAYADANQVPPERALDVLHLSAAMYRVPGCDANAAAQLAHDAFVPFRGPAWEAPGAIDGAVAAGINNIASGLQDRPLPDLRVPALRDALVAGAELAHRFWLRAGTWVNVERALYLRAMAGNALGDAQAARTHAREALALLDTHDTDHAEEVDRAFIELERQHACQRLGLHDEAAEAERAAQALAAKFDDAGLTRWFDGRRARLGTLPA